MTSKLASLKFFGYLHLCEQHTKTPATSAARKPSLHTWTAPQKTLMKLSSWKMAKQVTPVAKEEGTVQA